MPAASLMRFYADAAVSRRPKVQLLAMLETMVKDPNSHVATRRLTKAWEGQGARRPLYFYDFENDAFGERSSKSLLTAEHSYGYDVERFLNDTVENPLAGYLDSLEAGTLKTSLPWKHERALLLSLAFQGLRAHAARGNPQAVSELHDLLTKSDTYYDELATASSSMYHRFGCKLRGDQLLYFPSDGLAGIPLPGASTDCPAILFQPTSTTTFFALVPAGFSAAEAEARLGEVMENGLLVACSVGAKSRRVLIPPEMKQRVPESVLRQVLRQFRLASGRIIELVLGANRFPTP